MLLQPHAYTWQAATVSATALDKYGGNEGEFDHLIERCLVTVQFLHVAGLLVRFRLSLSLGLLRSHLLGPRSHWSALVVGGRPGAKSSPWTQRHGTCWAQGESCLRNESNAAGGTHINILLWIRTTNCVFRNVMCSWTLGGSM